MTRKEELCQINRTARALLELIARKEEYQALTSDLRLMIEMNEKEIFELIGTEVSTYERDGDRIYKTSPVDIE